MNESGRSVSPEASPPQATDFLVVGLGASAGGIQALQAFFENVPSDTGIAYVVILHLSPEHESRLAPVLQAVAAMPVTQVTERVRVKPDHVYVIAPDQHLSMVDGHIEVAPNTSLAERRAPVDIFFRTLAESLGPRAVCVVLSGTGANGSMGLKRIKERGGAAFVQDPREAEWDEMPRNSIATGLVDDVLTVSAIPSKIVAYQESIVTVSIPLQPDVRQPDQQQALREIFMQLRTRTGHDFSNYKRPTLLRRIERRLHVQGLTDLPAYNAFMRDNPDETQALLKDILISVTNFFRDRDPFELLDREILPQLLAAKSSQDALRIWVIGCATGEEAYSIAMLCAEHTLGVMEAPKVQIFATDIDTAALAHARDGVYSLNDAADVAPERLRRFFVREGDDFRIRREIREMILFANHNVIKDPPFSHLDLVTCRNVLIYLEAPAQALILETAHFALNPGGYLFLGTSESVGEATHLYATVGRQQHVFQSRAAAMRRFPVADKLPDFNARMQGGPQRFEETRRDTPRGTFADLHQHLLEQYAPPSLVVNAEYDIVHLSERAGRYLQMGGGEPSNNVLQLIRQELRLELRTALYQATARSTNVEVRDLSVTIDNRPETINIHVRPVTSPSNTARGFLLVLFEPSASAESDEERIYTSDEPVARQLEEELIRLKQQLRSTNEAHEIQAEELKASNEELQAMNEELRSAAEELETSREELQSINEELTTVNQELNIKIDEVSQTSNNLRNLVNSTDIATIFLDRAGHVQLFSPAVRTIFNLLATDVGRPLSDITSRLEATNLADDANGVLETLTSIEREVRTTDGRSYLMRLSPYRTSEDRIQGVVATFTDITERRRAEQAIAADLRDTGVLREMAVRLLRSGDMDALYQEIVQAAIAVTGADAGTVQILDHDTRELVIIASQGIDRNMGDHFRRVSAAANSPCALALATGQRTFVDFDTRGDDPDGSHALHLAAGLRSAQSTPLIARSGKPIGMLSTHWKFHHRPSERELRFVDLLARQAADLIEQRRSAVALAESEERLQAITDLVPDLLWSNDPRGAMDWFSQGWYAYTGQTFETAKGSGWLEAIHAEDRENTRRSFGDAIGSGKPLRAEPRIRSASGDYRFFLVQARPLEDVSGTIQRWFGAASDVHESRMAHEAMRASEERLRLAMESVVDYAILTIDAQGIIDSWNVGAQRAFGYTEAEAVGRSIDVIFTSEDRAQGVPADELRRARVAGRASDERWHLRKDGSRFFASGVLAPLRGAGVVTGYVKIARDLTEQKRAEDALRSAREELEVKVQERTRDLASANTSLRDEIAERRRAEESRLGLLQKLVSAQEGERRRISRELHDQLGQEVSALSLKLSILGRDEGIGSEVRDQLRELEKVARRIDSDLDFLVWELRPTALDDLGLREALADYAESWSKHFGIPAKVEFDGIGGRLPAEMETVLYRIAQEALNNVAKHARANSVSIQLAHADGTITLSIRDDGIGFDPAHPLAADTKGLGLVGMRERAALVGGNIDIASGTKQGTQVLVHLPMPSPPPTPPRPEAPARPARTMRRKPG